MTDQLPLTTVHDGDRAHINLGGSHPHEFQFGSVAGYAAVLGMNAEEAVQREIALGGDLFYAFNVGVTITLHSQQRKPVIDLELGQQVQFHGRVFRIDPTNNHNIKLVQISPEASETVVAPR